MLNLFMQADTTKRKTWAPFTESILTFRAFVDVLRSS